MARTRSPKDGPALARRLAAVAAVALAGAALSAGLVTEGAQELVWNAGTGPGEVATTVPSGYTVVTVEADATARSTLTVMRLHEGTTVEALRTALRAIDEAFMTGGDPAAAINEALELADVVGEVDVDPEGRASVGLVLSEGRYVLEHTPEPLDVDAAQVERAYHEFTVEGEAVASAPEADATVQFVDFAFAIPPGLGAGDQVWRVLNVGQQLHHMAIFSVPEGTTPEGFLEMMEAMEGPPAEGEDAPAGPEGAAPAGYVGIKSPGEETFHRLSLEPGSYMAVCFLPDHRGEQTGMPHFMLGMIQAFTVEGP